MKKQITLQDNNLMQKLQQIIPQFRKQIQSTLRSKHQQKLQSHLQSKRAQLKQKYQQKIKNLIQQKNLQIKQSLNQMIQMINSYKTTTKNKGLNKQQQNMFIEQTVDEILNNYYMLEEVKNRFKPKIEIKVENTLDKELQNGIQMVRRELMEKIQSDREIWTQERIEYWKQQSQSQLQQLAIELNQLNIKKNSIQANLVGKKNEKILVQQRLQSIMDKNARIAHLRQQLKQLKQVKC